MSPPDATRLREACAQLQAAGVRVALFIDPDPRQIEAAAAVGAPVVELHTGAYADAEGAAPGRRELERLRAAARARRAPRTRGARRARPATIDNVQPVAAHSARSSS